MSFFGCFSTATENFLKFHKKAILWYEIGDCYKMAILIFINKNDRIFYLYDSNMLSKLLTSFLRESRNNNYTISDIINSIKQKRLSNFLGRNQNKYDKIVVKIRTDTNVAPRNWCLNQIENFSNK